MAKTYRLPCGQCDEQTFVRADFTPVEWMCANGHTYSTSLPTDDEGELAEVGTYVADDDVDGPVQDGRRVE